MTQYAVMDSFVKLNRATATIILGKLCFVSFVGTVVSPADVNTEIPLFNIPNEMRSSTVAELAFSTSASAQTLSTHWPRIFKNANTNNRIMLRPGYTGSSQQLCASGMWIID